MKKIILKSMDLVNFKNLTKQIDFNEKETVIIGHNGTGKSTIYDAFCWLMFERDSNDQAKFNIKTLNQDGEVIRDIEHNVKAVFDIDGNELVIEKEFKEKIQNKRNLDDEVINDTTIYKINGENLKKKDFQAKLEEEFGLNEEKIKLLSNIYIFPNIKPIELRPFVLSLATVDDSKLKAKYSSLDLDKRHYTKIASDIKTKMTSLANEGTQLNAQIKALNDTITEIKEDEVNKALVEKQNELKAIDDDIKSKGADGKAEQINKLKDGIAETQRQIKQLQLDNEVDIRGNLAKKEIELNQTQASLDLKNDAIKADLLEEIKAKKAVDDMREAYKASRDAKVPDDLSLCPTCGQKLPEDKQKQALEKYNLDKAKKLEEIIKLGKETTLRYDEISKKLENDKQQAIALEKKIKELQEKITKLKQNLANAQNNEQLKKLIEKEKEQTKYLNDFINKPNEDIKALETKKSEVTAQIAELNKQLGQKTANDKIKQEIDKKQKQKDEIKVQYLAIRKQKNLLDEFIKEYTDLVQDEINAKFKTIKFKLFETTKEGELKEICKPTINGVPYKDLNTASKVNAGLEIVDVLSTVYGATVPVFVDNAESVEITDKSDNQRIFLKFVKDSELKVQQ